jgi:tRNA (guanine-N7-)-methyltransferase
MSRQKIKRFEAIRSLPNVIEYGHQNSIQMPINWHDFFGNDNPIVLELGCGRGEYCIELGKQNPNINYIGIDVKGDRIWIGAKEAFDKKLTNIAFVRGQIEYIDQIFQNTKIDQIWLTFSDPQPNNPKKRLTSPRFLKLYKQILNPNGTIHLKTDSDLLFLSTIEVLSLTKSKPNYSVITSQTILESNTITSIPSIKAADQDLEFLDKLNINVLAVTNDLYNSEFANIHFGIKTSFENKFTKLGQKIKYISFAIEEQ